MPQDKNSNAFWSAWEKRMGTVPSNVSEARDIMEALFPSLNKRALHRSNIPPQSVSRSRVYWERLLGEEIHADTSDRRVWAQVVNWTERGNSQELLELLFDDKDFCDRFEVLLLPGVGVSGEQVRLLASQLFGMMISAFGRTAHEDASPGFFALWRVALRIGSRNHYEFVRTEINRALRIGMRFALAIEYYWGSSSRGPSALSLSQGIELYAYIASLTKSELRDGHALAAVLDPSYPYTLSHLIQHGQSPEVKGDIVWSDYADVLLQAVVVDPEAVSPNLAMLFTKSAFSAESTLGQLTFNMEFVRSLFPKPDQEKELLASISVDRSCRFSLQNTQRRCVMLPD